MLHEVNMHPELNSWICFHRSTETVLGLAKKQSFSKKETTKYHTKQFPQIAGQDFAVWMSLKALRPSGLSFLFWLPGCCKLQDPAVHKAKYPQNGWTVAEHNASIPVSFGRAIVISMFKTNLNIVFCS